MKQFKIYCNLLQFKIYKSNKIFPAGAINRFSSCYIMSGKFYLSIKYLISNSMILLSSLYFNCDKKTLGIKILNNFLNEINLLQKVN